MFVNPQKDSPLAPPPSLTDVDNLARFPNTLSISQVDQTTAADIFYLYKSPAIVAQEGTKTEVIIKGVTDEMFATEVSDTEFKISIDKNLITGAGTYIIEITLKNDVSNFESKYFVDVEVAYVEKPEEPVVDEAAAEAAAEEEAEKAEAEPEVKKELTQAEKDAEEARK